MGSSLPGATVVACAGEASAGTGADAGEGFWHDGLGRGLRERLGCLEGRAGGRTVAGRPGGGADGQVGVAADRQPAVGAEAVFACVDGGAARTGGDAGLAQHGDRLALLQRAFERAQLAVDAIEHAQLGDHQWVVALAEAVQVEDQPAEVAVGELTGLAQEAHAPARAPACAEPDLLF